MVTLKYKNSYTKLLNMVYEKKNLLIISRRIFYTIILSIATSLSSMGVSSLSFAASEETHSSNVMAGANVSSTATLEAIQTIISLDQMNTRLSKIVNDLANFEAPIFVWDRVVLRPGEEVSSVIEQTPIRLDSGEIEQDKAVVISRGNTIFTNNTSQFNTDSNGTWFKVDLLINNQLHSTAAGPLIDGAGAVGDVCSVPTVSAVDLKPERVESFFCLFKATVQPDQSLMVRWTMFHPHPPEEHR